MVPSVILLFPVLQTLPENQLSLKLFSDSVIIDCASSTRMLLLESLQSKLLRCKLLEHMLDYACSEKSRLPVSLSLLLHFMRTCVLPQDPTVKTRTGISS